MSAAQANLAMLHRQDDSHVNLQACCTALYMLLYKNVFLQRIVYPRGRLVHAFEEEVLLILTHPTLPILIVNLVVDVLPDDHLLRIIASPLR